MRLNRASDFALRILMLLAKEKEPSSVHAIADRLGLARSHVMKLVAKLSAAGIIATQRGRTGGVQLKLSPKAIRIGDVVRTVESDFAVVDCLLDHQCDCVFLPRCALKPVMKAASDAFLECLDRHTLASILARTQTPRFESN